MDYEHGHIPRKSKHGEHEGSSKRIPLMPVDTPSSCQREIESRCQERKNDSHRPLCQRRERHADVKEPHKVTRAPFSVQAHPETIERERREKNQHTVSQGHPPKRDNFDVQEQHQSPNKADKGTAETGQNQILQENRGYPEQGRRKPRSEFVHSKEPVRGAHEPVQKNRLCDTQFIVESWADPIPCFEHFSSSFCVSPFVTVSQSHGAKAREKQKRCEAQQEDEVREVSGRCQPRLLSAALTVHRVVGEVMDLQTEELR